MRIHAATLFLSRSAFLPLLVAAIATPAIATADDASAPWARFRGQTLDSNVGKVCYAVATADVNGDGKRDVTAVTEDAVVWFENGSWAKKDIIRNATEKDNVCLQPQDIDGDGKIDFALGAAWRPTDTKAGGTLQWLKRQGDGWRVMPILSEPTMHRIRWGDVLGKGKPQLIAAPLQGRGTKAPNWNQGAGVRILVLTVPDNPARDPWPVEVADESLHTTHNLEIVDFDGDKKLDILICAWEGVFVLQRGSDGRWTKTKIGEGNQQAEPFKGTSEIKLGSLADGRKFAAAVEPWHGSQAVIYLAPAKSTTTATPDKLWERIAIDEPLNGGHAVWVANLDGDADQEVIVGHRDKNKDGVKTPVGPSVIVYDPKPSTDGGRLTFERHVIDDGGVAVEDLMADDLDGDGRADIIAGGRATRNVKIYWNQGPEPKASR